MDQRTYDQIVSKVAAFNQRTAATRDDRNLSQLGKRTAIVTDYERTREEIGKLRGDEADKIAARRKTLARDLFGLPAHASASDVVSYRDAVDRVAQTKTAAELGELMERASNTGDTMLLKAAAGRAYEGSRGLNGEGFDALVGAYCEEVPSAAPRLQEYREITSSASLTQSMAVNMATSVARPAEIDDRTVASDQEPVRVGGGFSLRGIVPESAT